MSGSVTIPCSQVLPHYTLTAQLEGVNYVLQFDWNDRGSEWFFTLMDTTLSPILAGAAIKLGQPLLSQTNDGRRPPGEFFAFDTSGQNVESGLTDLGGRVTFYYESIADLQTFGGYTGLVPS